MMFTRPTLYAPRGARHGWRPCRLCRRMPSAGSCGKTGRRGRLRTRLVLAHLGHQLPPQEEGMSSPVPNAASPDPTDPASQTPKTRREAVSSWSSATPPAGWSGALIAVGIISVVLGVIVLVWPKATLLVVAIMFGLQLIVAGAVRISVSRALPSEPGWLRPVSIGLGALSIVAGVICLFRPGTSLLVLAIFIAIGWIAEGIAAIAHGFGSDR